jgi:hypothetical protein
MELMPPWHEDNGAPLVKELERELAPGHVLYGVSVSALARHHDRDDVLFALNDGTLRVAVVHLTHSKGTDPHWPRTALFENLEAWLSSMRADHAEFGE